MPQPNIVTFDVAHTASAMLRNKSNSIPISIAFCLLSLSVALNSWNRPVVDAFRFNDLFLILAIGFVFAFGSMSRSLLLAYFGFFAILVLSLLLSMIRGDGGEISRFGFVYKYSLLFLVPIVLMAVLKSQFRLRIIERLVFYNLIVLAVWAYYYKFAIEGGSILGASRASFPGSIDFAASDAHLYSNVLSILIIFYLFYLRLSFRHGFLHSLLIGALGMGAVILTGSRNGIVVFVLSLLVWFILAVATGNVRLKGIHLLYGFVLLVLIFFGFSFLQEWWIDFFGEASERALNFALRQDASSLSRLGTLLTAISELETKSSLFGASIYGAKLPWYDSGIGIILAHTGIVGFVYILLLLSLFLLYIRRQFGFTVRESRISAMLLIVYVVSNLITEFSLVSRSALLSVLCIMLPLISVSLRGRSLRS